MLVTSWSSKTVFTLNELYGLIRDGLSLILDKNIALEPDYQGFRAGDVRHSLAAISDAQRLLGYQPNFSVDQGIKSALQWYVDTLADS